MCCCSTLLRCCACDLCGTVLDSLAECFGLKLATLLKLCYVLFNLVAIALSLLLLYLAQLALAFVHFIDCPAASGGQLLCLGTSAVYRLSLAMVLLYSFSALLCKNAPKSSLGWVRQCWACKLLLAGLLFLALLFVPNSVAVSGFRWAATCISLAVLLWQSVQMIDLSYLWAGSWKQKYDQGQTCYSTPLVLFTVLLYGLAIFVNIQIYLQFDCLEWMAIAVSVLMLAATVLQLSGVHSRGSLLATAFMCLYFAVIAFSASMSYDDLVCNPLYASTLGRALESTVELAILTVVLMKVSAEDGDEVKEDLQHDQESVEEPANEQLLQNQPKGLNPEQKWWKWMCLMGLSWFLIPMVLTNWGGLAAADEDLLRPNQAAFSIKLAFAAATVLLYLWTLLAPRLFPERDFQ